MYYFFFHSRSRVLDYANELLHQDKLVIISILYLPSQLRFFFCNQVATGSCVVVSIWWERRIIIVLKWRKKIKQ